MDFFLMIPRDSVTIRTGCSIAQQNGERKPMSMNELDQTLLVRCLEEQPRGWEDFVDRFMGLVVHVIEYSTRVRGQQITPEDRDLFCENVFATLYHDSFRLLREFDGQCSLTTYMTVVVRRIVVRLLLNRRSVCAVTSKIAA